MAVITPEFRASYARVFEPAPSNPDDPESDLVYSVQMIFSKDTDLSELKSAAEAAMAAKFGDDKSKWPKNYRSPFRDGDTERDQPEYQNAIFMNCKTKNQPGIVDQNVQPILSQDDFYSGCYARASIVFYGYDQRGNKGVGVGLNNLMKVRDGERLDGRRSAEEEFAAFAGAGTGDSPPSDDGSDDVPF